MKKLLIQLSIFLLFFFVVLGIISGINRYFLQRSLTKECILPSDARYLVLGDSHTESALNPAYFPGMINRAHSSECFFYNYAKAKYFIDNNPQIKVVILSFAPYRLGKWNEKKVFGSSRNMFYPIYFPVLAEYPEFFSKIIERGVDQTFFTYYAIHFMGIPTKENFNKIFQRKEGLTFIGAFLDEYKTNIENSKLHIHYDSYNKNSPYNYVGEFELENLYEMIQYLHHKGVQIVLYNAPCHSKYIEQIPDFMISYSDSIANYLSDKYNVKYINHMNYSLPDSLFRDYDHLNNKGASIVTPIVRDSISKQIVF